LKLIVKGLQASLIGLLLGLTGGELGLSTGKASLLIAGPELTKLSASLKGAIGICLLCGKANALLLLGGTEGVGEGLLVNWGHGLSRSHILLTGQVGCHEAGTVAAKRLGRLRVHEVGTLHALLLLEGLHRRIRNGLRVRIVKLVDVQGLRINILGTCSRQPGGVLVERLRGSGHHIRVLNTGLLCGVQGRNECIRIVAVSLKWLLGNVFCPRIDGIVPRHNLWRDFHLLRGLCCALAATHSLTSIFIRRLVSKPRCGFRRGNRLLTAHQKCAHTCGFCPSFYC